MKQAEPNPLQRELAKAQLAGPHPDADLLTGFAEGSLLEREREEILAHLASCSECRESLNVAADAVPNPIVESKPFLLARPTPAPLRNWLPWASIAAGIVLVCAVGLVYRQRLEMKEQTGTENVAATSAPVQPMPPTPSERNAEVSATTSEPKAAKLKTVEPIRETLPTESAGAIPAEESIQPDASDKKAVTETAAAQATQEDHVLTSRTQALPAPGFAAQAPSRMMSTSSLSAALIARPTWRINPAGAAERSFGNGVWQRVLPDDSTTMRVVSVFNRDVWVGGDASRLYHSADGGDSWTPIQLPPKNGSDHAIVHIAVQTDQNVTAKADDGTSWTTADGGVTWK